MLQYQRVSNSLISFGNFHTQLQIEMQFIRYPPWLVSFQMIDHYHLHASKTSLFLDVPSICCQVSYVFEISRLQFSSMIILKSHVKIAS